MLEKTLLGINKIIYSLKYYPVIHASTANCR